MLKLYVGRHKKKSARALGNLRDTRAIEPLTDMMLTGPYEDYRREAISALCNIGWPAIPSFEKAIKHGDMWLRNRATEALHYIRGW